MIEAGERRTEVVSVRVSPEQRQTLAERARLCGQPLSTFMRQVALGSVPRARPNRLEEAAVYHLGRIGNNLNQLARAANATGRLPDADRLKDAVEELLGAIRRLA